MAKKPKLYTAPAAHGTDNKTKCPGTCSENTHCRRYMEQVNKRMKALGADTKLADPSWTGDAGARKRVKEANEWGAAVCYVAHTNAGGGRYSMTMHHPDAASKKKAEVFHKYRKCVATHKVVARDDLYEINATNMVCLYDELFFHDNAEDCAWFHNGGMELMVEETCQALCEILKLKYKAPEKPIYKVTVSALTASQATALVKELKKDGYTAKKAKA